MGEVIWVPIVVAIITGPLVAVIQKLRKENSTDHATVQLGLGKILDKFDHLDGKVDHISERVDNHLDWHMDRKDK